MNLHIDGMSSSYSQIKRLYPNTSFPSRPNEADMRERGHYFEPTPRPEGDVVTQGQSEQHEDGTWHQTWVVRDYAEEELAEQEAQRQEEEKERLSMLFTYKTDIWQRCSEDEAEVLDAALQSASARERRMWDDSITIEHSSNYYAMLREQMIEQFGESRTDEILAPSEGEAL